MRAKTLLFIPIAIYLISCGGSVEISTSNFAEVVKLPDGSFALLNENSSIEYEEDFNKREVIQEGEVFYSIVSGNGIFTIKTDKGEIQVMGTEFNVKSTADDLEVEVEKGAVKVKSGEFAQELKKGEKAVVKSINDGIEVLEAEFKYKQWTKSLEKDLENLGKNVEEETRKIGKELNKEIKKIGK